MKKTFVLIPILLLFGSASFAVPVPAPGDNRISTSANGQQRDPLTDTESDQIRELADQPDKRIELFLKFIGARFDTIDQMQGDARLAAGRGQKTHDLLQDITSLVDELDDNVDDYVDKKEDVRKSLKKVIEADTSYQLKLRTLKDRNQSSKEFGDYNFVLQDATDAVNGSLDDAREALDEQEKTMKEEKKKK
ncbi:MAG: hypothetical protein ACRD3E_20435 [Terriglobales bacterium]